MPKLVGQAAGRVLFSGEGRQRRQQSPHVEAQQGNNEPQHGEQHRLHTERICQHRAQCAEHGAKYCVGDHTPAVIAERSAELRFSSLASMASREQNTAAHAETVGTGREADQKQRAEAPTADLGRGPAPAEQQPDQQDGKNSTAQVQQTLGAAAFSGLITE